MPTQDTDGGEQPLLAFQRIKILDISSRRSCWCSSAAVSSHKYCFRAFGDKFAQESISLWPRTFDLPGVDNPRCLSFLVGPFIQPASGSLINRPHHYEFIDLHPALQCSRNFESHINRSESD